MIARILKRLKRIISPKKKIKVVLGAGDIPSDGWIVTDIHTLNVTREEDFSRICRSHIITNLFAEHVWEHLSDSDTEIANRNCYKFLEKGGILRIAVPDGYFPDPHYIDYVKPGGHGAGADDHKILYNYKTLTKSLEKAGFKVKLLEYWDENGIFHFHEWTDEGGHVLRSKRYDKRNLNGQLGYTSLIVDAIKP